MKEKILLILLILEILWILMAPFLFGIALPLILLYFVLGTTNENSYIIVSIYYSIYVIFWFCALDKIYYLKDKENKK